MHPPKHFIEAVEKVRNFIKVIYYFYLLFLQQNTFLIYEFMQKKLHKVNVDRFAESQQEKNGLLTTFHKLGFF